MSRGLSLTRFTTGSIAFEGSSWTLTPAHPGDTEVLWGTGGGADPANDLGGSSGDQTVARNFGVTVAGVVITPLYSGTSPGYPGLWQINFTLPSTIASDCFSRLQVSAGGQLINGVVLPIAPAGQSACSTPGFTSATLAKLDAGSAVTYAGLFFGRTTYVSGSTITVTDNGGGQFARCSAAEWELPFIGPSVGPCRVLDETYPAGGKEPSSPDTYLDNGAALSFSGPGLPAGFTLDSITSFPPGTNYYAQFPNLPLVPGGTYTLTGSGGADVQAFSVSQNLPSSFTVSNFDSITQINRRQALTLSWTGTGLDFVIVEIGSAQSTTTTIHSFEVTCTVPAGPGSYIVPAAALTYLLPSASSAYLGTWAAQYPNGSVTDVHTASQGFTPNLIGGGQVDFGISGSFIEFLTPVSIQ
jgi:hypothetical protein